MRLVFTDKDENEVTVSTVSTAQKAINRALDLPTLKEKLDRMGNTPFVLKNLVVHGAGELIVPFSDINEARRRGTDILMQKRLAQRQKVKIAWDDFANHKNAYLLPSSSQRTRKLPLLNVAVSNYIQALQALKAGADRIYIGLEGLGTHRRLTENELEQLLAFGNQNNRQIIPIIPRIRKPSDTDPTTKLVIEKISGVMVGNPGAIKWALDKGISVMADYTVNVFNQYTLNFLLNQGLVGACLSPELNFKQLQGFPDFDKVELMVHGELTLMVSQHCMLSGVLGDNGGKCEGFCLKDDYHIRDDLGYEFPVETDADCRFYVFNSRTLCMMDDLDKIVALKPGSIRIEARRTGEQEIFTIVKLYREALNKLSNDEEPDLNWYKEELARVSGSSFTKCHYYRGVL
jgi:putative protease